ncbi:MAG TPA: tannase/feruloyl esterase family alpha/beta hydrolase [Rhodocyclaceae bacterium]|nr:tannase/feruloyl esterase family alpha/beta hydrolase [Rhodocyclaceae bacterium]
MTKRASKYFRSLNLRGLTGLAFAWSIAVALSAALMFSSRAEASGGLANLPAVQPVMTCAQVTGLDLSDAADAAVTLKSATIVGAGTPAPYCEVRGTIAPANTLVVRLPINGWTQRYVQTGCGGLCGSANINYGVGITCAPVADGTVASATTDMGHQGGGGAWATDNPQALIDFAYRGVHVTSKVTKALIAKFYGKRPAYSYFIGCSDGGREALMEAQRYPEDFDGIVAGAPANNMVVQNSYHHTWNVLANKDADGKFILLSGKLPMLHSAVLNACDAQDGVTDGLITDPRACHFNPTSIQCTTGQDPATCLTAAEAGVVRRLHDGATDAHGRFLEVPGAHEWGSELSWTLFVPATATPANPVFSENIALDFLRYLAFFNTYNPSYKLTDLPFTVAGFWQTMQTSIYESALDPDLKRFAKHGGKLLLWHGWNDQHIPPRNTIDYYDAVRRSMGEQRADKFVKLYLLPGVTHCGGGEGPDTIELLQPLMAWVEGRVEPGKVITSKVVGGVVTRTRPVFPYPAVARYVGNGSINDAVNFVAATPYYHERHDEGDWEGKDLFSHGYQANCKAVGTQLVCNPSSLQLKHARSEHDHH